LRSVCDARKPDNRDVRQRRGAPRRTNLVDTLDNSPMSMCLRQVRRPPYPARFRMRNDTKSENATFIEYEVRSADMCGCLDREAFLDTMFLASLIPREDGSLVDDQGRNLGWWRETPESDRRNF